VSILKATEYLKKYGLEDRIMEFTVSSATVSDAAKALGCKEEEIVKTLSFMVDDMPILIAAAGDCKIDNRKFKEEFKTKAKMIPFEAVEELIGHGVGGVCPFGIKEGVKVYLDDSVRRFAVVYPAAGTANSAVKLTVEELELASEFSEWVDVTKLPENE